MTTTIDDPVLAAVQRFMDAVEVRLTKQTDDTRTALAEMRSVFSEMQTRGAQAGLPGADGAPGERGADGVAGKDGRDGKDGERGEKGEPGERGADGLAGRDGAPGEKGERGADGLIGQRGEQGERGADGLAGRDGAPGLQGERGERGADGIATLEELDARIEARFADLQVRTIADSYQGVFEPEKSYARGILTTWGGSLWLSLNATSSKPGEGADWRLVVKRGADGRK